MNISLVDPLQISLSKKQYLQILRTFDYALAFPDGVVRPVLQRSRVLSGFGSEASDVESELGTVPSVRQEMFGENQDNVATTPSVLMKGMLPQLLYCKKMQKIKTDI
jgi:hypothetical protein